MCVQEAEQLCLDMDRENQLDGNRRNSWPLHCELSHTQVDNFDRGSSFETSTDQIGVADSLPVRYGFFLWSSMLDGLSSRSVLCFLLLWYFFLCQVIDSFQIVF